MIDLFRQHGPLPLNLALYTACVLWYGYHGDWGRAWYWFAALQITVAVTWGM